MNDATPTSEPAASAPADVHLEYLCSLDISFGTVPTVSTPTGTRMLFSVRSGTVEGPRLRGVVVPGTLDWVTVGSDGLARIDVRGIVQTHDGAAIQLTTTGRADLGEHTGRFLAGEEVGADDAYIRTCPLFETSDSRYAWPNRLVTVARCDLSISRIRYRISALA
ncbi:DUF3237 domain-containing protein [Actinomadura viridis]|uniref:DUF3237 domain-containing protein n=1 Tax=Actinomadura viridis TaxID=58110 RepID=UPI0036929028